MEECNSILQALGPLDGKEERDSLWIDYMSKQLEDLRTKYQAVASEACYFMVSQGKWGT